MATVSLPFAGCKTIPSNSILGTAVLLVALCQMPVPAVAQSGVLIGLYSSQFNDANDEFAKPAAEFKEIWVAWDGKQIEFTDVPALMVPRADGWWRIGASKSCKA